MAEMQRIEKLKVPEFLREPLEAAQVRFGQIEEEAQRVLKDLMVRGRAGRKDIEHMMQRLSRQDWNLPEVKHRLGKLREQGVERAAEWRGKAETFRTEALERVTDLQTRAVAFLGVATRDQVEELSRELERLARRLDRAEKGRRNAKKARAEG
ncbi:conserved hypothetical protein [Anaeromyxobacter sp. K]|uniref:hypothetical protein n=1 Tax=Anaeromyxobacter sp. (strain K) TaxID=447217 RepID=UPI00015F8EC4|nr:hypothetical protein [Anaeromyxobacter sp. K]ACG73790.1 conserved hypothetical protein [Anaeromyxobacter sp. K]